MIRVNKDEKKLVEELSREVGMNVSEYIRNIINETKETEHLKLHLKIVEKYEKTLDEFRTLLNKTKRKSKG